MKYAVIFTYSFDGEVAVYLFSDEDSAKEFLRSSYEEELRIDCEENGWDVCGEIFDDGWYAKIANNFIDHENVTEFRIGNVYACQGNAWKTGKKRSQERRCLPQRVRRKTRATRGGTNYGKM